MYFCELMPIIILPFCLPPSTSSIHVPGGDPSKHFPLSSCTHTPGENTCACATRSLAPKTRNRQHSGSSLRALPARKAAFLGGRCRIGNACVGRTTKGQASQHQPKTLQEEPPVLCVGVGVRVGRGVG